MPKGKYKHKPLSEVHKKKIGLSQIGRKRSAETRRKCSLAQMGNKKVLGKKFSDAHKKKISQANKGKPSKLRGRKLTTETRVKMSIGKRKAGRAKVIYKRNMRVRRSLRYKLMREAVFIRDNYTCQECKQKGGKLEAHHIKSFSQFPHLRFELINIITLCKKCHSLTDNYQFKALKK